MTDTATHQPLVFFGNAAYHTLHLGNYLGALRNWVKLQEKMPCIYCVVDMHALTVEGDPKALAQSTREVTAAYIAAGVDPARSSCSTSRKSWPMRNSPGCSTAWRGSAG